MHTYVEAAAPSEDGPSGRFTRQQRILKSAQFKQVFNGGKRIGNRYLGMVVMENGLGYARLGLAISKRQVRFAVGRNRIKRVARESFRHHQRQLQGLDIIIMARSAAASADKVQLHKAMESLWRELAK